MRQISRITIPPGLLTQKEAAAYLRVSAPYLRNCECEKVLLPGQGKKGKPMVRYRISDLDAFAARHLASDQFKAAS